MIFFRSSFKICKILTLLICYFLGLLICSSALAASFQGLGDLPGGSTESKAYGISANGSVVVGGSSSSRGREAFRWTSLTGMTGIQDLFGGSFFSNASGVSADGVMIVGQSLSSRGYEAFRRTKRGNMEALGDLPGSFFWSGASAASAGGSTVAGFSHSSALSSFEAFRWTKNNRMVGLGALSEDDTESWTDDISSDGFVIVGYSRSSARTEAFRWTAKTGMVGLGDLPGGSFSSWAKGISARGSVIVGSANSHSGTEAFRWTAKTGMVGLGRLPGSSRSTTANAASAGGSVIVGQSGFGSSGEAFVWYRGKGMYRIQSILEGFGIDLTGWKLSAATDVSASGNTIVGYGINPNGQDEAWIARLGGVNRSGGGGTGGGTGGGFDDLEKELDVLDPACSSHTTCQGAYLRPKENSAAIIDATDFDDLLTANIRRYGVVTDGVTTLLLRMKSDSAVTFSIKKPDDSPAGSEYGAIVRLDGSGDAPSVAVGPVSTSAGKYVFAAYRAPKDFPGTQEDIASGLTITISARPATGEGDDFSLELHPPPIVLVHGIWDNKAESWIGLEGYLKQAGFRVCNGCRLNYGTVSPAGSFDPQATDLADQRPVRTLTLATRLALRAMRSDDIAVTQVDVVGHSMGGLVARSRVAAKFDPYKTLGNYNQGTFHKIITVGTPHLGTPLADFFVANKCDRLPFLGTIGPRIEDLFKGLGRPIGPAIFEFQTSSFALEHLGATDVPSHALVGLAPENSRTESFFNRIIGWAGHNDTSIDSLLNAGSGHDTIVPFRSQGGRNLTTTISPVVHTRLPLGGSEVGETASEQIWTEVKNLLLTDIDFFDFDVFHPFIRTGTPLTPEETQCPPEFRRSAARAGSATLMPALETEVSPGQTVNIELIITDGNPVDGAIFIVRDKVEVVEGGGPFVISYEVPSNEAGAIVIEAHTFGPGPENYSASTSLDVTLDRPIIFLSASPPFVRLSNVGDVQQINVTGHFEDDSTVDLTRRSAETFYVDSSGRGLIVSVSPDGLIEANDAGNATIRIIHADQTTEVIVEVIPEQHLALNQGWNMASVYIYDETKTVDQIKRELSVSGTIWVWGRDAHRWRAMADDENLQPGVGYWLNSSAARSTVTLTGDQPQYSIELKIGWNLIGAPSRPVLLTELQGTEALLGNLWYWDAPNQQYKHLAEGDTLQPGLAYWAYAKQAGTLTLRDNQSSARSLTPELQEPLDPSQYVTTDSPDNYGSNACFDARDYAETWSTKDDGDTYAYWVATNSIDPSKAYSYYGGKDDSYTSWEVAKSASTIADTTCQSDRWRRAGRRWYRSQGTIGGYGLIRKDDNQGHVILSQDDQMYSKNATINWCYRPRAIENGEERRYRDKRRWRSRYWRRRGYYSSPSKTYTIHHAAYGQKQFRYLCDEAKKRP